MDPSLLSQKVDVFNRSSIFCEMVWTQGASLLRFLDPSIFLPLITKSLGVRKTDKTKTQRAVDLANKQMSEGMLPPQLRAPGRTNITTQQGKNREAIRNFFKPSEDSKDFGLGMYDMKDGGRVTKRKGAAKRGFGKAFKGGK